MQRAPGRFDMQTGGTWDRTADFVVTGRHPPHPPELHHTVRQNQVMILNPLYQ